MKLKLLHILAILAITVSPIMAGNNTTVVDNPTQYISDEPMTEALESGDSNISFSDGYKGYCIEWGEHSAEKGDKFYVHARMSTTTSRHSSYTSMRSHRETSSPPST